MDLSGSIFRPFVSLRALPQQPFTWRRINNCTPKWTGNRAQAYGCCNKVGQNVSNDQQQKGNARNFADVYQRQQHIVTTSQVANKAFARRAICVSYTQLSDTNKVWPYIGQYILSITNTTKQKQNWITALFNNMRTLKFKAQTTNAFFAAVSQTFGGSSQLTTTAEYCFVV